MKNASVLFLFFISCPTIAVFEHSAHRQNSTRQKEHFLEYASATPAIVKRHIFRIAGAMILWAKRREIFALVQSHPYISAVLLIGCIRYAADLHSMHSRIKKDFIVLQKIEELYSLISYATEISNVMIAASSSARSFNSNEHFRLLVQDIPYSFEELEKITLHMLVRWKLTLKEKYPALYPPVKGFVEKEIYLADVDKFICCFYENPLEEYPHVCTKIAIQIKKLVDEIDQFNIIDQL